jgi:hypothetical protein
MVKLGAAVLVALFGVVSAALLVATIVALMDFLAYWQR